VKPVQDAVETLKTRVAVAAGEIPADRVLRGGRVVNVFSGRIREADVAVSGGVIAGVGPKYHGREEVDVSGRWIVPGLIDGHIHIESTLMTPPELARALLVHGTTAIVSDPHEIANVMGMAGIRLLLRESEGVPLDIFFMAPSCVPATHLETAGAVLAARDLDPLKAVPRVLGLAEMMNFPGVVSGDPGVLEKIALFEDRVLDGHCPGLSGPGLQAYVSAGIRSDHEITGMTEGREKLDAGMMIMIREGTSARNLADLLPLVTPLNARRFCFVSDDLHPDDIVDRGHLDFMVKKAVRLGMDPVTALRLATLNPAEYFGMKNRGAVAPGYRADLVVLDDLEDFRVADVYKDGRRAADLLSPAEAAGPAEPPGPLNMPVPEPSALRIPAKSGRARVMELVPGQIATRAVSLPVRTENGFVVPDVAADVLKLCVFERHRRSGRVGLGLVRGFGLRRGALASSVAHDAHNVIAVGVTDADIIAAAGTVREMGGGLCAAWDDRRVVLPLEVAGLMSGRPVKELARDLGRVRSAARELGCGLGAPFMALSFLALPVIPELKLTDRGLVDVNRFEIVPLFEAD